ncbi:TetR family transcriptional regulator [Corynebacterium kutscheri]|uniref:TetR family transcriptional regulator n=1 Tax=Corynebacterium kutscheri TaxID=35755 RepID=A0A0F6TDC9_9CORY|nr:TetR family transcriptional regulator [Corynebacterium kutscheri]AKE40774.1 transcriptional regulator, TetR family [Corynebacterium kutscheri]VEH04526.1 TetR family transcriptional regulator [Corynebacterium kutscheri]VEH11172.1 TetR family transcriptional regulator [Corynebacterium kutscheri]VEH80350.1 TetR family transcriptional regulator [Corynebacterium kutscheri]
MRTSKKQLLIKTALELVEKHGLDGLTYEALSQASGLSKSGLIYHFPSRDALLKDMNQFMIEDFEQQLIATAGGTADEVDLLNRLKATLIVLSRSATRAELLLSLEIHNNTELHDAWDNIFYRWGCHQDGIDKEPIFYLCKVIADGMWLHDHISTAPLTQQHREKLIATALALLDSTNI